MRPSPNKTLIQCGFVNCRKWCNRDYSEDIPEGTPIEKIKWDIGKIPRTLYCTGCHRYTVYLPSASAVERAVERYKNKSK